MKNNLKCYFQSFQLISIQIFNFRKFKGEKKTKKKSLWDFHDNGKYPISKVGRFKYENVNFSKLLWLNRPIFLKNLLTVNVEFPD
jgi:hypothetical protein